MCQTLLRDLLDAGPHDLQPVIEPMPCLPHMALFVSPGAQFLHPHQKRAHMSQWGPAQPQDKPVSKAQGLSA